MPLYEFKCASCEDTFEKLVLASGNGTVTCPKCGSNDVKKLFSSFGFTSSERNSLAKATSACSSCSSSSCATCSK
ncbi:MAG: zinc ribbon domain-containing protein [Firmicutes bacterium]|nr:zinc ribbon domain-containing protein [Bacillota bacterium]